MALTAQLREEPTAATVILADYAEYILTEILRTSVRRPDALEENAAGLNSNQLRTILAALEKLPNDLQACLEALFDMRSNLSRDPQQLHDAEICRFVTSLPVSVFSQSDRAHNAVNQFKFARALLCLELTRCLHSPLMNREDFFRDVFAQVSDESARVVLRERH